MEKIGKNSFIRPWPARLRKKPASALDRNLRTVKLFCNLNLLLGHLGRILTLAGAGAILALCLARLAAVHVWNYPTLLSTAAAGILALLFLWLRRRPSSMQIALLIDQRLQLHERFSTALALANSTDPFARAALAEAHAAAEQIHPRALFPIRPARSWGYAGGVWLLAGVLFFALPQKDLLGRLSQRRSQQEQALAVQQAQADIRQTTRAVQMAVKQLDANLADELAGLERMPPDAKPETLRREAIRKLDNLADKLKKAQGEAQLDAVPMLRQMLKQLRGTPEAFSQQMRLALAQGNFSQAAEMVEQLQKQLAEGKLSEKDRQETARQLRDMGKQLQELSQKTDQLQKELEKQGLNKELAKLNEQELRQALQKQGLNQEQAEKLLEKARACRACQAQASQLGQAMGAGGGENDLSGTDLAALAEQLGEMKDLSQKFQLSKETLAQIEQAAACLGQCPGLGPGRQGPWAPGAAQSSGPGTGGPGQGYGARPTAQSGPTGLEKTRIEGPTGNGPVIASWYFKETQVKGAAQRDFTAVVQAARDSAAEAISDNQIPRRYEDAVKTYFGQLDQSETPPGKN